MTLRHMRIFLEVYRTLSVTKAAENLHMTQPAVTRAIQEIERYYGIKLFERYHHRLYETPLAREVYAYAVHIDETFSLMEKTLLNQDAMGTLRVGASITLGNYDLPAIVTAMRAKRPALRIQATIANGARLEEMLLENELDLALIEGAVTHGDLRRERFAGDRLVLITAPEHPLERQARVTLSDLTRWNLILREEGSAGRTFLDRVCEARGLHLAPVWESASTQAIVRAVADGVGISVLPEKLVEEGLSQGMIRVCPIADESLERDMYLVHHVNKFVSPTMNLFKDIVMHLHESDASPAVPI